MDRKRDRQVDRKRDRQVGAHRKIDGEIERCTGKQTGGQTDRQMGRQASSLARSTPSTEGLTDLFYNNE